MDKQLLSMFKILYVFLRHTYFLHIFMSSHNGFIATCSGAARNMAILFFFSSKGRPANRACFPFKGAHIRDWFADKSSTNILGRNFNDGFFFSEWREAKKSPFSRKKPHNIVHCNTFLIFFQSKIQLAVWLKDYFWQNINITTYFLNLMVTAWFFL